MCFPHSKIIWNNFPRFWMSLLTEVLLYTTKRMWRLKTGRTLGETIKSIPIKHQVMKWRMERPFGNPEGMMPWKFSVSNLNLEGARWICQLMGVDAEDFYEAIATFKGASKRLELIAEAENAVAYKDYAHPSKVSATTRAVKQQYPSAL